MKNIKLLSELAQINNLAALINGNYNQALPKEKRQLFSKKVSELHRKFVEVFVETDFNTLDEQVRDEPIQKIPTQTVAGTLKSTVKNGVVTIESIGDEPANTAAFKAPEDAPEKKEPVKPVPESIDLSVLEDALKGYSEKTSDESPLITLVENKPAKKGMVRRIEKKD